MTERGIMMSAPMVRALLSEIREPGTGKTQTRRLAWHEYAPKQHADVTRIRRVPKSVVKVPGLLGWWQPTPWQTVKPGDVLWVRETFCIVRETLDYETGGAASAYEWDADHGDPQPHLGGDARGGLRAAIYYPADGEDATPSEMWPCIGLNGKVLREKEIRWRPAIHMPRWACRITLAVTEVRPVRLHDISEVDAIAEGVREPSLRLLGGELAQAVWSERQMFQRLWNHLHGPDSWARNPELIAMSFIPKALPA